MNLFKIFPSRTGKGGTAELLAIAFPMIISTACDGIMTFTDRLFLSRLGPEQMNAAFGGGIALQLMTFFFIGLTGYTTALVAQYYGAKQDRMTGVALSQAVLISIIAYPVILLCKPLGVMFFNFMEIPPVQLVYQTEYFNVVILGSIASILRNSFSCYFSGIGRTRIVMIANITAMVVNVALDYLLVFGNAGFPAMGIKGAAIATVSAGTTGLLILIASYFSRRNFRDFHIAGSFRFDAGVMKKLLHFGSPAGVEFFLNFLAFTTCTYIFHSRGTIVATASTIMFNWDLISFIPLIGIEIAVTSLAGRYMGAGDPKTAHHAAMSGIRSGMYYSVVILVLFLLIPRDLVMIFRPLEETTEFNLAIPIAIDMIRLASLYVLLEAVLIALIGALRGAGDTHVTMILSSSAHWTMTLVVYLCLKVFDVSAVAAWLAMIVAFMIFCVFIIIRYSSMKWQKIKVIHKN